MGFNHNGAAGFGLAVLGLVLALPSGAQTLVNDNFNGENGGNGALNYNAFANFNVTGGSVDLIGNGFFDFYPGHGLYVDLDGTTGQGGTLTSKTNFNLTAGTYLLEFNLGGSQRGDTNQVNVALGSVFSESFIRASSDPLATVSRTFNIASNTTGMLSFQNLGGDNVGAILDDVHLERLDRGPNVTPEGDSLAMLAMGGLPVAAGLGRKFRRKKA